MDVHEEHRRRQCAPIAARRFEHAEPMRTVKMHADELDIDVPLVRRLVDR
jgi:hypothetical protein